MAKLSPGIAAKFYTFSFFDNFILIYPLYAVMFADAGLKPFQISSLFVAWSLTGFIVELPAGSIADKFGRKNTLLIGTSAKLIGFGFWLFMRTYLGFLLGFIFWGIKSAMTSGAREAIVYDELKQADASSSYAKVMGRMDSLTLFGVILAGFAASIFAHTGYSLILVLSMVSVIVSGISLYLLPNLPVYKEIADTKYFEYLKEGVKEVLHKPIVLYLVLLTGVIVGIGAIEEYFGLLFRDKGFTNTSIAFWMAIVYAIGSLGSLLAHRLENKKIKPEYALCICAALLFVAVLVPRYFAPIVLGLYFMVGLAAQVLFNVYLQRHISDKTRATTTSVGGLASEIFALLAYLAVSIGASRGGYVYGFELTAVLVVLIAAALGLYAHIHKLSVTDREQSES